MDNKEENLKASASVPSPNASSTTTPKVASTPVKEVAPVRSSPVTSSVTGNAKENTSSPETVAVAKTEPSPKPAPVPVAPTISEKSTTPQVTPENKKTPSTNSVLSSPLAKETSTAPKSNENPNLKSVDLPTKEPTPVSASQPTPKEEIVQVPKFEIPAEKKEEVHIDGAKNELANFSAIFNQDSEEKAEVQNKSVAAPQVSINAQEKAIVEKEKATIKAEQEKAAQAIIDKKNAEETAKRKKQEIAKNFNAQEKVVFTINEEKEGSPLVVVGFFAIVAIFVLVLPKISKLDTINFSTPVVTQKEEETETTDDYYYFNKSSETKIGDLTISNLVKSTKNSEYFVSLTITNNSEKNYFFDKKYYIVFYQNDSIIYRALLHSYDAVGSLEAIDLTLVISQRAYESADKIKMEEIETVRYPDLNITTSDGDYKVLTCTYLTDEMKYYFYNDGLQKINEVYKVTKSSNNNYQSLKDQYKSLYNKYNQIDNFTSLFIETDTDFEIRNEINLKDISDQTISNLKTYKFFKYNETPEIVSFEIEAQGYTCS